MTDVKAPLAAFAAYAASLSGDEKGEAQVFCDRLFQAFGHEGYKQAGATLEGRVRTRSGGTRFADLVWKPRLLLEMKKRGEKLARHRDQACDYWRDLVPNRPRYVLLCNFDEIWIYDFDTQVDEPVDRVLIADLPRRYTALGFLFPDAQKPLFGNDRTAVTNEAAARIGDVFRALVKRGENRETAQRFTLQCVVALFAEDIGLLPRALFTSIIADCRTGTASSYDLFGGLFRQMNSREAARGGRFRGVDYFNGGLFAQTEPVELTREDLELLERAANEDWSRINPAIFGSLFQASMSVETRHQRGAHYTHEADIQRIVLPTLVRPLREELERASTLDQLRALRERLTGVRVLDPACGSGNFLYVAYRELMRLEIELLEKIHSELGPRARKAIGTSNLVNALQLFGLDIDPFAVELAKVTLSFGKKLALDEARDRLADVEGDLPLAFESPLPLDNLEENVRCDDALFCAWPQADVVIGNPPYQSKNKMQQELGAPYMRRLREKYPDVPGRADYCVYWFRRAHDELPPGGRAGLVGTNTIRQNYSREGGLDHIVTTGGTITEAVSTQVWPGEAVVHVSLVNWVKGAAGGKKKLFTQMGDRLDSPWRVDEVDRIPSSLSAGIDVTGAKPLRANSESGACYQGQTHGHEGFLLEPDEARRLRAESASAKVIHPYLIGDDLVGSVDGRPGRWIIDLNDCEDLLSASRFGKAFAVVRDRVRDDIVAAASAEAKKTGSETGPRQSHARRWWRLWRGRGELISRLSRIPRYIACSRVTKRPIFSFVSSTIRPSDVVMAFPLPDDYSFGILQSGFHAQWFTARCSTMKGDPRYTSDSVFDSFPWPQAPLPRAVEAVAEAGRALRLGRRQFMAGHGLTLRALYASLEEPGEHPLRKLHEALDAAVRQAYGARKADDPLEFLLALNSTLAGRESHGEFVAGPGLPPGTPNAARLVSSDAVTAGPLGS